MLSQEDYLAQCRRSMAVLLLRLRWTPQDLLDSPSSLVEEMIDYLAEEAGRRDAVDELMELSD